MPAKRSPPACGRFCRAQRAGLLLAAALLLCSADATGGPPDVSTPQPAESIIDLQPFRHTASMRLAGPGRAPATVSLVDLNPEIGRWYLLRITPDGGAAPDDYHLENPFPSRQRLALDPAVPDGLVRLQGSRSTVCPLWQAGEGALQAARRSGQVYAPLCDGTLYLRNPATGRRTAIEAVTDLLRDKLPGGDAVVGFVRDTFFKDAYRETAGTAAEAAPSAAKRKPGYPAPARVSAKSAARATLPRDLGILTEAGQAGWQAGQWYAATAIPGVFVSLMQPGDAAPDILDSYPRRVNPLDSVESGALAYLVAFDLGQFEVGYAVGTEHPRVDWSERILPEMKLADRPGPDGIDSIRPLVPNGMVDPDEAVLTVATFTAGFKRIHGAFRYGDLATRNHGSHYGFVQEGVILSTLEPGLATLVVSADGTLTMKTWSEADNQGLGKIRHARQNGVPLIEEDPVLGQPVPGRLVNHWLPGNWAGSSEKKLRTLRAGAALQQEGESRFLIYGYFSTATPSAMARVFQAYGVRYAMQLDMNALEHTYLALYRRDGDRLLVEHLIEGMSVLDKSEKGEYVPRFLGYADNRDFFYVMRRQGPP